MFLFHAAFSLGLIALALGTFLYAWASREKGCGTCFAKFIGIVVILVSLGNMVCTAYYGIKYWREGYFENPMQMHKMMQNKSMMNGDNMSGTMDNQNNSQQHTVHH